MVNGFFNYLKDKRRLVLVAVLIAAGFLLILIPLSGNEEITPETDSLSEYKAGLEQELAQVASSVKGVGKCRVLITFERGEQNTYRGSELIESKPPLVLGVTVVCTGADRDSVRAELTEMMTALFNIPSTRVAILKYG